MAENNRVQNIDFSYYFSEAYKIEFEPYSKRVESDLSNLINSEILKYKYSDVFVIGRKGINLFQPYIAKVNGKNNLQGIYAIQLFSFSEHPLVKILHPIYVSGFKPLRIFETFRKRHSANKILLTDAIKTGHEIIEVIDTLKRDKISKVCGYLANKNGLSELQKEFPEIQFSFSKIVDDIDYDKEQDRLQHIYQSRLIPIDGDHPYKIYSLKYQISTDDLVIYVNDAISKFKLPDTDIKKDVLIVPHISSYTLNLDFEAVSKENPDLKQDFYEIERLQMRFKIDPKNSQLRIMALALDQTNNLVANGGHSIEFQKCGMKILKKICDGICIPNPLKDKPEEKICPLCIDVHISNFIISYTEKELFKILDSKGVKIERMAL
jgi:hypothetical protein